MANSCELWIVKVANEEELFFYSIFLTENPNWKSVGLPGGNINVIQNFSRSCLIIRTTSCQNKSFCYMETLTKPRSCRDSYSAYLWQYNHVLIEHRFYYLLYFDVDRHVAL